MSSLKKIKNASLYPLDRWTLKTLKIFLKTTNLEIISILRKTYKFDILGPLGPRKFSPKQIEQPMNRSKNMKKGKFICLVP